MPIFTPPPVHMMSDDPRNSVVAKTLQLAREKKEREESLYKHPLGFGGIFSDTASQAS